MNKEFQRSSLSFFFKIDTIDDKVEKAKRQLVMNLKKFKEISREADFWNPRAIVRSESGLKRNRVMKLEDKLKKLEEKIDYLWAKDDEKKLNESKTSEESESQVEINENLKVIVEMLEKLSKNQKNPMKK